MMFTGASSHPLLLDWNVWFQSTEFVWATEWRVLAARGMALACNDAFIAAMIAARLNARFGPTGLRASSLFDDAPGKAGTSDATRAIRRQITAICAATWYGKDIDAEGSRTRADFERTLAWMAIVLGDGIAVRTWRNGRSRWRIVSPDRVANPPNRCNDDRLRDGFVLDAAGAICGMYVYRGQVGPYGVWTAEEQPELIDWYAQDGTPNIIHCVGYRLPGMIRGVSELAPMIILSRQLGGVMESHVAAKRLQAIMGIITEAEDPEAFKAAAATGDALDPYRFSVKGPLNLWVVPPGAAAGTKFTDTKFNGADLKDYLMICYKVQCAVWQMPVDVVLCQMGEASLSSARAGLDQFDRTAQGDQEKQIAECTSVIDRVEVAGAKARGELVLPTENWSQIMLAKYQRPPKYSTDREKDADTIKKLMDAGVSGHTAYEMFGMNWEDERELGRAEDEFDRAQALPADTDITVQEASLNGAQIDSLVAILASVAAGTMPVESARGVILAAFPSIDETEADRILKPMTKVEPPAPAAAAPGAPPAAGPSTSNEPIAAVKPWWRRALRFPTSTRAAA